MKYLKRAGFITMVMLLMFFAGSGCGTPRGGDLALVGIWLPEEVGPASGNFPDKLELFKDGTGGGDGRIDANAWFAKDGQLLLRNISRSTISYLYDVTDSKLTLTSGGISSTYISSEKALANKEERARKLEELRNEEAAVAMQAWEEIGTSFLTDMVFVNGGTFTMGCTLEQGNDCGDYAKPAHEVTLSDFYIGKYEVSQVQWRSVMGNNPFNSESDNLPVENVSFVDVQEFIRKLNEKTGENYRLPTEAEWEYAARGGSLSNGYKYSGSNDFGDVGWYRSNSNSNDTAHPVGTKISNELDIHDMSGNVSEWVSDWYGKYSDSPQMNPKGPANSRLELLLSKLSTKRLTSRERVVRGGGGDSSLSFRYSVAPGIRFSTVGFRLARDI